MNWGTPVSTNELFSQTRPTSFVLASVGPHLLAGRWVRGEVRRPSGWQTKSLPAGTCLQRRWHSHVSGLGRCSVCLCLVSSFSLPLRFFWPSAIFAAPPLLPLPQGLTSLVDVNCFYAPGRSDSLEMDGVLLSSTPHVARCSRRACTHQLADFPHFLSVCSIRCFHPRPAASTHVCRQLSNRGERT